MGVFPVEPGAWVIGMGEKEMRDEACGPSLRRSQSQGRWARPFTGLWEHSLGHWGLDSLDHSFSSNRYLDASGAWLSFCRHGAPATLRTSACCL